MLSKFYLVLFKVKRGRIFTISGYTHLLHRQSKIVRLDVDNYLSISSRWAYNSVSSVGKSLGPECQRSRVQASHIAEFFSVFIFSENHLLIVSVSLINTKILLGIDILSIFLIFTQQQNFSSDKEMLNSFILLWKKGSEIVIKKWNSFREITFNTNKQNQYIFVYTP